MRPPSALQVLLLLSSLGYASATGHKSHLPNGAHAHHHASIIAARPESIPLSPLDPNHPDALALRGLSSDLPSPDNALPSNPGAHMHASVSPHGEHHALTPRTARALSLFFPLGTPLAGPSNAFSTHPSASPSIRVGLSDSSAFRPTNVLKSTQHSYKSAPDGRKALRAYYPEGSYTFGGPVKGGFSFYAKGPVGGGGGGGARLAWDRAREVTFGYAVWFPAGFGFQKGGKLPGIYGGNSDGEAQSCSGGRRSDACFSSRLMWRSAGAGELYTYLPSAPSNAKQCSYPPQSDCNPTYGASVGRGSFRFATGRWTVVTQRVRLNSVGKADGEIEVWADGERVILLEGMVLRTSGAGKFRGMMFQTFFGGSSPSFASPKNQELFMADFSVAITERF